MHHAGCCHRDLKPSNILVDSDMRVHIIDFGIAEHKASVNLDTQQRDGPIGTYGFMAPEVWRG